LRRYRLSFFAAKINIILNEDRRAVTHERGLLINGPADKPDLCDFLPGSIVQRRFKIAISTNGKSQPDRKAIKTDLE